MPVFAQGLEVQKGTKVAKIGNCDLFSSLDRLSGIVGPGKVHKEKSNSQSKKEKYVRNNGKAGQEGSE